MRDRHAQVARYQRLVRTIAEGGNGRRPSMPKQRGFQHVLARARQYRAWLDDGTHRSLSSIARAEGVTSGRIGDILDVLTLSPAIRAAIDVPADRLPRGTTHEELRRIGRRSGAGGLVCSAPSPRSEDQLGDAWK